MSRRVRRPGIELDDVERAARLELLRLGERKQGKDDGRGTRLCVLLNPDDMAEIGLPRWLVEQDLMLSLDRWAEREVPSRRPVNLELDTDPSLGRCKARVWLMPGRARSVRPVPVNHAPPQTADPGQGKHDRIARAGNARHPKRGYSAMSTLEARGGQSTRSRTAIAILTIATLIAALLFLAGPALADVHAEPGPAPDVESVEKEAVADGTEATEGSGRWLPAVLIAALALGGAAMIYGAYALFTRSKGRPAESFPDTVGHRVVDEGIHARQQSQADTSVMLDNVRSVRDVARQQDVPDAVDASVKLEQTLQQIRQKIEATPAGRLAASTGREGRLAAAVDNDLDAARALQNLADDLVQLRRQAIENGGGDLAARLTEIQNRADDVRDMLTRRPELIQD